MKTFRLTLKTTLLALGTTFLACSSSPDVSGPGTGGDGDSNGDGDAGDGDAGDGDSGDGDFNLGDGDGDSGDGDGNGDGDSGDGDSGDGDSGMGGAIIAPPWEYPDDVDFPYTPITGGGETCGSVEGNPESVSRPIDIIFVIDNSSSMRPVIEEVERSIHTDFSAIIEASEIDYRVIIISRYGSSSGPDVGGSDFQICIPTPLGGHDCESPNSKLPVNTGRFFHYSADIESLDAMCVLLESFDEPDEFDPDNNPLNDGGIRNTWPPFAENGWSQWLRNDAFKTFVMITDDDVECQTDDLFADGTAEQNFDLNLNDNNNVTGGNNVADAVETALFSLSATHFGSAESRNYVFHSIVGMQPNTGGDAWPASEPIQTDNRCEVETGNLADGRGTGYQALSIKTDGLRYPVCPDDPSDTSTVNFDPIFNEIAQGVIETAAIPCEFDFPEVEGIINPDNIKVRYTPSSGGDDVEFSKVSDAGACTAGDDFYFDDNNAPTKLFLCGSACTTVQDDAGELTLDFGCLGN